jgi:fructose-specific phosphotransferase system IIC component
MEELLRIMRHPAGRVGLTVGLIAGFIAAFMGGVRRMFLLIGLFIGLIAFWQHVMFSSCRDAIHRVPTGKQQVDKGD